MRARALLALAAASVLRPAPLHAAGEPLRLETPRKIDALRIADVDGDGRSDVVTLSGRTACAWVAGKDALLATAPRWRVEVPADVSFVDVARVDGPALLGLGAEIAMRIPFDGAPPRPLPGTAGLGWRDGARAAFADLYVNSTARHRFLFPDPGGWRLEPGESTGIRGPLPGLERPTAEVSPTGPFLEDVATLRTRTPRLVAFHDAQTTPGPGGVPTRVAWGLVDQELRCWTTERTTIAYDVSFLPAAGDRHLLFLDRDTLPDLIHREHDNREAKYAFFLTPEPREEGRSAVAPDLRPPAAFLRLAGFNLDPDYVDVDGDGLVDFVVTTIAQDASNILRAVATGKVTATTLAFLQRKRAPDVAMFPTQPDATVTSEIGVRIRFAHTGTIDVTRSFTILTTGDLDGDGRKDLVIRSGPATLQVRRGTADGVWAKDATAIAIPSVGPGEECEATAADLDGQPGDEILLLYRGVDAAPDRLVLLKP